MRPGKLHGLRRLAGPNGTFEILAIDQRPPLYDLVARHDSRDIQRHVFDLKRSVIEQLQQHATATLVDPPTALGLFERLDPRCGLLLTLEDHRFRDVASGRMSHTIDGWSVERISSTGADAVKLLAWYRDDAGRQSRRHQEDLVASVGDACREHDTPFVLELLVYPLRADRGEVPSEQRVDLVLRSLQRFADPKYGVDLFKVESPLDLRHRSPNLDPNMLQGTFGEVDSIVQRPWVVLSGGANRVDFLDVVRHACKAGASGYLAGRSIWWNSVTRFPDPAVAHSLREDAVRYMRTLHDVVDDLAHPWHAQARTLGLASVTVNAADRSS